MRIALVAPPWASPYRPSIQLGTLQAWLRREAPDVVVDAFHDHLAVARWMDYGTVRRVADGLVSSWLGEVLAASLLFPERHGLIRAYLEHLVRDAEPALDVRDDLLLPFSRYVNHRARRLAEGEYSLVGLSVCLSQTLTSLLLARRVRALTDAPHIVLGGPAVAGPAGRSVLDVFPEIDAVVEGEGERPLAAMVERLNAGADLEALAGVTTRLSEAGTGCDQLPDLTCLPPVDYDAYFEALDGLAARPAILEELELPVEGSRGCWWDRRARRAGASCQFCNLNLQWSGYRARPVERQLADMRHLLERHEAHDAHRFLFVDNVPRRSRAELEALFGGIRDNLPRPVRIYLEARANLPADLWPLLAEAGVRDCQVGIEALSTPVLRRLNKGTSALMNLESMKHMERAGIASCGNLLYDLPGVPADELDVEVAMVALARAYGPLAATRLILTYGSPYYDELLAGAPEADHNDSVWQLVLPSDVDERLFFTQRAWKPSDPEAGAAAARLVDACARWQAHYGREKAAGVTCLLGLGRDGSRWVVEDRREEETVVHELSEAEARVCQVFDFRRRVDRATGLVDELGEQRMALAMERLEARGLFVREGAHALALPILIEAPTEAG